MPGEARPGKAAAQCDQPPLHRVAEPVPPSECRSRSRIISCLIVSTVRGDKCRYGGNLLHPLAADDEPQHLPLTRGQADIGPAALHVAISVKARRPSAPGLMYLCPCSTASIAWTSSSPLDCFNTNPPAPSRNASAASRAIRVHRQHDHPGRVAVRAQLPQPFQPAHRRQRDVRDHRVGTQPPHHFAQRTAVGDGADDLEAVAEGIRRIASVNTT